MANIMMWSGGDDGCRFYRLDMPAEQLRLAGHTVMVHHSWQSTYRYAGGDWSKPDVLVGQRVVLDGPSQTWQKACMRADSYCVYEIDDDLMNVDASSQWAFELYSQANIRENIKTNIMMAHAVTVSTEELANRVRNLNRNVIVIPNTIRQEMIDWPANIAERETIGWAGSGTHSMDWQYCRPGIERMLRDFRGDIHMIGGKYRLKAPYARFRHTEWFERVPDYWAALDFNVGLIPLKPHVFNQSKSDIKLLEYAARGIPVIASDVGPYSKHRVHALLVKQDHEWSRALRTLRESRELVAELVGRGLEFAAERTSEKYVSRYLAAYNLA